MFINLTKRYTVLMNKLSEIFKILYYLFFYYLDYLFDFKFRKKHNFSYNPLISIIVPVYNTNLSFLLKMIQSVENQIYQNWELIIYDDYSNNPKLEDLLKKIKINKKIKCIFGDRNLGISLATSKAIEFSEGEYITFLDHDDLIKKNALETIVLNLQDEKKADFLYTNEELFYHIPFVRLRAAKINFSMMRLISSNYICHMVIVSRTTLNMIGGYREGFNGSQDHEFTLRVTHFTKNIKFIDKSLYEWRIHKNSFSQTKSQICNDSSKKAISEYFEKIKINLDNINSGYSKFTYHPVLKVIDDSITIIIIINDVNSLHNYIEFLIKICKIKINLVLLYKIKLDFNYRDYPLDIKIYEINEYLPKVLNNVIKELNTTKFIILTTDIIPEENTINELIQISNFQNSGMVGSLILDSNNKIKYSGFILGKKGFVAPSGEGINIDSFSILKTENLVDKNVSALSYLGSLFNRNIFLKIGGFDERFENYYWDIDYSMRLNQLEFNLFYNPFAIFHTKKQLFKEFSIFSFNSDKKLLIKKYNDLLYKDLYYSSKNDLLLNEHYPKFPLHDSIIKIIKFLNYLIL